MRSIFKQIQVDNEVFASWPNSRIGRCLAKRSKSSSVVNISKLLFAAIAHINPSFEQSCPSKNIFLLVSTTLARKTLHYSKMSD